MENEVRHLSLDGQTNPIDVSHEKLKSKDGRISTTQIKEYESRKRNVSEDEGLSGTAFGAFYGAVLGFDHDNSASLHALGWHIHVDTQYQNAISLVSVPSVILLRHLLLWRHRYQSLKQNDGLSEHALRPCLGRHVFELYFSFSCPISSKPLLLVICDAGTLAPLEMTSI
jgi:hypothetical protein